MLERLDDVYEVDPTADELESSSTQDFLDELEELRSFKSNIPSAQTLRRVQSRLSKPTIRYERNYEYFNHAHPDFEHYVYPPVYLRSDPDTVRFLVDGKVVDTHPPFEDFRQVTSACGSSLSREIDFLSLCSDDTFSQSSGVKETSCRSYSDSGYEDGYSQITDSDNESVSGESCVSDCSFVSAVLQSHKSELDYVKSVLVSACVERKCDQDVKIQQPVIEDEPQSIEDKPQSSEDGGFHHAASRGEKTHHPTIFSYLVSQRLTHTVTTAELTIPEVYEQCSYDDSWFRSSSQEYYHVLLSKIGSDTVYRRQTIDDFIYRRDGWTDTVLIYDIRRVGIRPVGYRPNSSMLSHRQ